MKKFLRFVLPVFIMLALVSSALADVAVNASNFPDANFMSYVSTNFDTDRDDVLSDAEIAAATRLNLRPNNVGKITSLQGIEFFTSLVSLDVYGYSENNQHALTSLDLSNNKDLVYLNCAENSLTELNLTQNTALISLDCSYNSLQELDVTQNTALTFLDFSGNRIKEIDVSQNTALIALRCTRNLLTQLDVSNQTLIQLFCEYNKLTELDLSNSSNSLINLRVSGNSISNLNDTIKTIPNLTVLGCNNCNLTELDLSNKTALRTLTVANNMLETIDISNIAQLYYFDCSENNLKSITWGNLEDLQYLHCNYNQFAALDIPEGLGKNQNGYRIELSSQKINNLQLSEETGEYSYILDFSNYMSSDQVKNVVSSSIQAFDDNDDEITVAYENGKAKFKVEPMYVKYIYNAGYEEYFEELYNDTCRMDVTISNGDLSVFSYKNHVYKFFDANHYNFYTWNEAKEYCESLGGHLPTITSEEEKNALLEMYKKILVRNSGRGGYSYWLGTANSGSGWSSWITGEDFNDELFEIDETYYADKSKTAYLTVAFETENNDKKMVFIADNGELFGRSYLLCEWDPDSADLAKLSQEYLDWSADREAYYNKNSGDLLGAVPEPIDFSHLADNPPQDSSFSSSSFSLAAWPSKYDPRGNGVLSAVKNQNPYGTCWAFASLGALEASYVAQGLGNTAPDTSELHVAWFVYKDPRPKFRFSLNDPKDEILDQGGSASKAISFLSRVGAAKEADLSYSQAANVEKLTAGKYPENYTKAIRVKEAYRLGSVTDTNRNIVKNLVTKYGAVWICFYYSRSGLNNDVSYYLKNKTGGGYHAVDIVGWDDNYSRSNFPTSPSKNGAWLCRNSWGTGRHDGGYFWISYEQEINDAAVFIAGEDEVKKMYGHDTQAAVNSTGYRWSANIFRASTAESISEVAFYTGDNNAPYEVYLINYGKSNPATPGVPTGNPAAKGTFAYAGYHTLALTEPLEVEAGEYFGVMVKLTPASKYGFVTGAQNHENISTSEIAIAGKSYFAMQYKDGTPTSADWKDGARLNSSYYSAPIKAFATSSGPAKITTSSLPQGAVNTAYSCSLSASGSRPITWTVTGLPSTLTHDNGKITGTPKETGSYEVKITAENNLGSDSKTLKLVIGTSSPDDDNSDNNNNRNSSGGGGCKTGGSFASIAAIMLFAVMIKIKLSRS